MENEFNEIERDGDSIDLEVRQLLRDVEDRERYRRAVIDMLVMLGSDAMLEYDV
jgi:hypothetical protein